ncbi:hypothetical protein AB0L20_32305, partial [Streptomyces albidoflavus]|uniref:phage adaptor protein n=1 Tax=Streptomyces albidoflavus TaxID=1886 RepID=UPI00342AD96D
MPLSNYSELQASIADWMDREDLVARIPDFIQLGQAKLRRVLRVREMEISTTLSPINGVCFLPTNYEEFRAVYASTGTGKPLELFTPDFAIEKYGWSAPAGVPQYFTLIGNELRPYPSTTGEVGLIYYQTIPDIAGAPDGENWLLTKDPRTYLFASL